MHFLVRFFPIPLIAGVLLVSCAIPTAYYQNLSLMTEQGQFSEAAEFTEKSKETVYGEKNALLYYLDKGMFLHLSGNYAQSNEAFEEAKKLAREYFTKSITTEASTLLVSDNMRPYYGEDFERALIHVFCAINYILLGNEEESLVEARQVDHFLTTIQTNYGHKSVYKEDAFARYLMGMLYENKGEINDAFISYWKAIESYEANLKNFNVPVPPELVNDAFRTAVKLGFSDDVEQLKKKWGSLLKPDNATGRGEIVVLLYNGFCPEKVDNFFEISFGKAWIYVNSFHSEGEEQAQVQKAGRIARSILAEEQVSIAFPKYVPIEYTAETFSAGIINSSGAAVSNSTGELAENIGAIAVKNLDDRIARVRIRAIVRAAIKFALSHEISNSVQKESNSKALGWLAKKILTAVSTATELADKRSWRSLPDKILMARMGARPGTYNLKINFYTRAGAGAGSRTFNDVRILPGKKTFIVVRSVI